MYKVLARGAKLWWSTCKLCASICFSNNNSMNLYRCASTCFRYMYGSTVEKASNLEFSNFTEMDSRWEGQSTFETCWCVKGTIYIKRPLRGFFGSVSRTEFSDVARGLLLWKTKLIFSIHLAHIDVTFSAFYGKPAKKRKMEPLVDEGRRTTFFFSTNCGCQAGSQKIKDAPWYTLIHKILVNYLNYKFTLNE